MDNDLISRQAAIDAICKACSMEGDYHKCDGYPETSTWCEELVALRALPSAQPEPCEDAVSRKMAMDAITASTPYCVVPDDYHISVVDMEFRISTLPSVTPKQKTGKAVVKSDGEKGFWVCNQCGERVHTWDKYCSECGAKLKGDE